MRHLLIAIALLAAPSVAGADGLPGTAGYPVRSWQMVGCFIGESCHTFRVSAQAYEFPGSSYNLAIRAYDLTSVWLNPEWSYYTIPAVASGTPGLPGEDCFPFDGGPISGPITYAAGMTGFDCISSAGSDWSPTTVTMPFFVSNGTGPFAQGATEYRTYNVTFTTTPEAGSFALLASGLAGLLAVRRRRSRGGDNHPSLR
jgi:MYXO-CTERM domain-containing protein